MFTFKSSAIKALAIAATAYLAAGCISDNLPYPWVMPTCETFEVASTDAEGHQLLSAPVDIDSASRSITIYLTEYANIKSVEVEKWELSEGSVCLTPEILERPLDLSTPVEVVFELYNRELTWTISAVQNIERYFTVASQIGAADINAEEHTVKAYVPEQQELSSIAVRSIKLAGPLAVMTPDIEGEHVDFSSPVTIAVEEFGETTDWTITIEQTEVSVAINSVDAWTQVAWVYGSAETGKNNGFEYRTADAEEWTAVPAEWLTIDGGSFSACIRHLEAETDYVVRAYSDDEYSAEVEFTTGRILQLPNNTFTDWWLDGKVWCPWAQDSDPFWGTGNRGAATLGQSNTVPIEDYTSATGYQGAMLQTKFIGVSILGKLASGNLFAGTYVRTDGTNGVLDFGREFSARPTGVRVKLKYTTAPITDCSSSNPDLKYMKGEPDTCIVWCALTDDDKPYEIRTKPSDRQLFDQNNQKVIAYGQFESGSSIDDYIDVTFTLDYKSTDRVPTYLLLTASASKYGDYFTGGRGATLYIKEYELLYDY